MEPEFKDNNQEPFIIREQSDHSSSLWYIIIIILLLVAVGWYGFTAGWFGTTEQESANPILTEESFEERIIVNPAPIDSIRIETGESFPIQQTLIINGTLPNGCTMVNEPTQLRDGNIFYITLEAVTEGDICTQSLVPYEKQVVLQTNNLPAGVYIVNVNGTEISFELESDNSLDFQAGGDK